MSDPTTIGDILDNLPPVGSNNPPADANPLRERLQEESGALLKRRDELLAGASRIPDKIEDDEIAGKVADFIKLVSACTKNAEGLRVARKEPFLESGRVVDGFFKAVTEPLEKAKGQISARLTVWQRQKAAEEKRLRDEAEAIARIAATKAAEAAREAERAAQNDAQLATAIEAAAAAKQAAADAVVAERAAAAKPADMSRTRGDVGAVASLVQFWDFTDLNRDAIDLEALRQHLPADALEKAVRSFVKAGGRTLAGVRIFENTKSRVA